MKIPNISFAFLLFFSSWADFPVTLGFTLNANGIAKRRRVLCLLARRPSPEFRGEREGARPCVLQQLPLTHSQEMTTGLLGSACLRLAL